MKDLVWVYAPGAVNRCVIPEHAFVSFSEGADVCRKMDANGDVVWVAKYGAGEVLVVPFNVSSLFRE
jgi:hypothetical protein